MTVASALDAQTAIYDMAIRQGRVPSKKMAADMTPGELAFTVAAQKLALVGDCYSITRPIVDLLDTAGQQLPDWTLEETDLPSPSGFLWFDRPIEIEEIRGQRAFWNGYAWCPVKSSEKAGGDRGIVLFVLETLPQYAAHMHAGLSVPFRVTAPAWLFGEKLTVAETKGYKRDTWVAGEDELWLHRCMATFASFLAFVNDDILRIGRERAPRMTRKRALSTLGSAPDIRVIELRRIRYIDRGDTVKEEAEVEWSCQWIVRGHWRNQWYATTQTHRPKWIAPYVKGPDDKPLKATTNLFEVKR